MPSSTDRQQLLATNSQGTQEESRSRLLLPTSLVCMFLLGFEIALKPAFYPIMAHRKGVPPSQYGLILAFLDLMILLTSIPFGEKVYHFGPRRSVIFGLCVLGLSNIGLGVISFVNDPGVFVSLSAICRISEGIGYVSVYVSLYAVMTALFADLSGSVISKIEFMFSLGGIIGPILGGLLIDLQSFLLPFVILGTLMVCMAPVMAFTLRAVSSQRDEIVRHKICALLRWPKVYIAIFAILVPYLGNGFQNMALEDHLNQFGLSKTTYGAVFMIPSLLYGSSALVWGRLCDKGVPPYRIIMLGLLLQIFGMGLVGPLAWVPVKPQLYLVAPGLIIYGAGIGGTIIPSIVHMRQVCSERGYSLNVDINAVVSAVYVTSMSIGASAGQSLGGIALERLHFRVAHFIFISLMGVQLVILVILFPRFARRVMQ